MKFPSATESMVLNFLFLLIIRGEGIGKALKVIAVPVAIPVIVSALTISLILKLNRAFLDKSFIFLMS